MASPRKQRFAYVYILVSACGVHRYVGLTTDLKSRLRKHNAGEVAEIAERLPLGALFIDFSINNLAAIANAWGVAVAEKTAVLKQSIYRSIEDATALRGAVWSGRPMLDALRRLGG